MVRNYIRKKTVTYCPGSMRKAIEKVKNKELTLGKAAALYGIPKSTLTDRVRGHKGEVTGRPTAFSQSTEKNMAAALHKMERCGFSLTKKEVIALVGNYATRNNITTKFKNNLPGVDWFFSFTKRHKLTLKTYQALDSKRLDPFVIYGFYELLLKTVQRFNIDPSRIYLFSEAIFNVNDAEEIVSIHPYYSKIRSGEQNTTVLLVANACGEKITPLITKDSVLWNYWVYNNNKNQKSHTNPRVFENYFENIVFPKLCTNKDHLLIIYDGRSTHIDIHIFNRAAKNNITIIKLPPNISLLDPLEDIKNTIKYYLERQLSAWKDDNLGHLQDDEFSCFVTQAWEEINPNMLSKGFKKAGIWPIDRDQFPRELFEESTLADWEKYISNEGKVISEPFVVKNELIESELDMEVETLGSDTIMNEIMNNNCDKIEVNNDKDGEISDRTDNQDEISYEFIPSYKEMAACRVEIPKISMKDLKNQKESNEIVEDPDPLSDPGLSRGLTNLAHAMNNLCGELSSVRKEMSSFRKEMSSFKQEFVKMTSTMANFNKRVTNIEKLQYSTDR